jgi:hypothetical protein
MNIFLIQYWLWDTVVRSSTNFVLVFLKQFQSIDKGLPNVYGFIIEP